MPHLLRVAFWGALAVQLFALYLYQPGDGAPDPIRHLDKLVHVAIFALPAACGVLARLPVWLVGGALAIHAPVSELAQHLWLPRRGADVWDVVADWTGLVLGLMAGRLLLTRIGANRSGQRRRRRRGRR